MGEEEAAPGDRKTRLVRKEEPVLWMSGMWKVPH